MLRHCSYCLLCQSSLYDDKHGICAVCRKQLPLLNANCIRCGLTKSDSKEKLCEPCQKEPPIWQYLTAVSDYTLPLNHLMQQFKFQQRFELADALARLMLLSWLHNYRQHAFPKPDIITCVPLHYRRFWRRGFNQSALLAKPLAHWLERPFWPTLLRRRASKADQKSLNAVQRSQNLRNLFTCQQTLMQQHIALVDDIVTTGSTANEISRQLYANGAASVQIITLCRTL